MSSVSAPVKGPKAGPRAHRRKPSVPLYPEAARPPASPAIAPPAPPIPQPTSRLPEGWRPGGDQSPAPAPASAAPKVRHGRLRLEIQIGESVYRVRPGQAPPPIEGLVILAKIDGPVDGPGYAVATDGLDFHCSCPDHSMGGHICKHIQAVRALARIFAAFAIPATEGGAL